MFLLINETAYRYEDLKTMSIGTNVVDTQSIEPEGEDTEEQTIISELFKQNVTHVKAADQLLFCFNDDRRFVIQITPEGEWMAVDDFEESTKYENIDEHVKSQRRKCLQAIIATIHQAYEDNKVLVDVNGVLNTFAPKYFKVN